MFHNVLHAGFILCILLVFVINTNATLSFTTISTAAGSGSTTFSGDNGAATSAGIRTPAGIAFDSSGNIYVSDAFRVRIITIATGIISTYVGTGSTTYNGDGGVASSATLYNPQGLDFDSSNNLYIAERGNNRLRKVTYTTSIISTIAGTGSTANNGAVISLDNGPATLGILYNPCGVAVDSSGNVYIGDFNNHRIRKVTAATSIISTVAGTGTGGYSGDGDAATSALIKRPYCVTIDSSGNIYFGDYNGFNVVRKITVSTGIISTVAGLWSNNGGYSGDNGAATSAALNYPIGVSLDGSSNLYITDYKNNRIRKVDVSTGLISTVVGTGTASSTGDAGSATSATVKGPLFSRFDSGYNNFYITEYDGNLVRKVVSTGSPTIMPSSVSPTFTPTTRNPTVIPTRIPTKTPTFVPTVIPTTPTPTLAPTIIPTKIPTKIPTFAPTMIPTVIPTTKPTVAPTLIPTEVPTIVPTDIPTETPTFEPTFAPSFSPTATVNENSTALILPSFGVGVWNDPNTAVSGAAVSADGELYLSDSGTQMVMRYDTSASSWVSYISPNNISLNSSLSIHIPNSNRRRLSYSISSDSVFVTDTYNNRVLLCNATNSCIDYVSASLGYTPYSAVVSYKDGYVYFRSTNKIVKCTGINVCSNYFSTSMILNGRSVTAGFNIAFDDSGYVFFQDTDARRIVKCKTGSSSASCAEYTTADELYDNVTLGNYSLNTIGVDSFRSWVYISDMDNSRVILCKGSSSCSAIMSSLTYIENVEFTSPSCFTIDSHGAIYVVDMTRVILYLEQGVVITDSPSYVPSFSPSAEPTFAPTKYVYSLYDPLSLGVYGSILALSILIWLGLLIVMVMFSLSQTNDRSFEASYKLSPAVYTIAFCAMVQLSDYVYWFTVNFQNGFLFIVYGGILFVFPTLPFIYELYHLRAHPSMFIHYYPGKAFAHNWLGLYGICYFWLSMDPAGHPLFLMRHQHKTTYHNIGFHFAEHESIPKILYFILLWIILVVLQVFTLIPFYLWCLFFTPYFMLLLITGVFAYQFKFMSISTVWNLWFRYWVGHTERFEKSIINNIDTDHLNKSIFVYFIVALGPILGSQFYNYQHATDAEKSQFLYWFPPIIGSILFIGSCIRYSYWILHKGVNIGDVPVRLSFSDDAHLDNHKETKNARLVKNYDRKKNLLKIDHLIENFVLEEIDDWSKSVDRVVSGHLSSVKSDVKQKIYEHKNKLIGRFRKFKYQISREDAANEVWRLLMTSCVDFRIVEWLQAQEITEPSHLVGISPKLREDLIKQIPRGDNDVVVKRKIRTLLEMIFIDHNESILVRSSSKRLVNADDSIDVNRISLVNTDKGDHLIVDSENELSADIHMLQSVKSQTYKSVTKIDPFVDRNSDDGIDEK